MSRTARIAFVVAVAGALVAGMIVATDDRRREEPPAAITAGPDPMSEALARCRDMGTAALDDRTCQATWRAARDQFFGEPTQERGHE